MYCNIFHSSSLPQNPKSSQVFSSWYWSPDTFFGGAQEFGINFWLEILRSSYEIPHCLLFQRPIHPLNHFQSCPTCPIFPNYQQQQQQQQQQQPKKAGTKRLNISFMRSSASTSTHDLHDETWPNILPTLLAACRCAGLGSGAFCRGCSSASKVASCSTCGCNQRSFHPFWMLKRRESLWKRCWG